MHAGNRDAACMRPRNRARSMSPCPAQLCPAPPQPRPPMARPPQARCRRQLRTPPGCRGGRAPFGGTISTARSWTGTSGASTWVPATGGGATTSCRWERGRGAAGDREGGCWGEHEGGCMEGPGSSRRACAARQTGRQPPARPGQDLCLCAPPSPPLVRCSRTQTVWTMCEWMAATCTSLHSKWVGWGRAAGSLGSQECAGFCVALAVCAWDLQAQVCTSHPLCAASPAAAQDGNSYTSGRINTKQHASFYPGMRVGGGRRGWQGMGCCLQHLRHEQ